LEREMTKPDATATVVAAAGRRIDSVGAMPERFPLRNCGRVRDAISSLFRERTPAIVISSASCGSDLLALEAAEKLGIRYRVVLPFSADRFRGSSVTDRPGEWGPVFDRLVAASALRGDLVTLDHREGVATDDAYAATNVAILDEADARAAASGAVRIAAIAWEGGSRGADDLTDQFRREAASRGWEIVEVPTR
jgi:hypothetical protein